MAKYLYPGIFIASLILITFYNVMLGMGPIAGDDIWAATSVMGSWIDAIVFTLRFDLHPPLYYFLLNIWAVFDQSDFWLRFSSFVIHAFLTTSVFYITNKRTNYNAAVVAAVLVFICPGLVEYSNNLRMYGLIALLSVWIYYFVEKASQENSRVLITIFLLEIALVYTHAIGILFVFFHCVYGLALRYSYNKKTIFKWLLMHAGVFLLSVPVLLNSFVKSADHAAIPSLLSMLQVYSPVVLSKTPVLGLNIGIGLLFLSILMLNRPGRLIFVCYVIAPALTFYLISVLVKPLWLSRNFIFVFPIILMSVAYTITSIRWLGKHVVWAGLAIIMLANIGLQLGYRQHQDNSLSLALKEINVKKNMEPKVCVVIEDSLDKYWSILRYAVGLDWGNPLVIQPLPSEKWVGILKGIPSPILDVLHLIPEKNYVSKGNLIVTADRTLGCQNIAEDNFLFVKK